MELTKELIESLNLSEDQVKGVSEYGENIIATTKKEFEGVANKNAEAIISGAASKTEQLTGIKRTDGEKIGDYLNRVGGDFLQSKQSELDQIKSDYEEKIKGVKDAGTLKAEFENMKAEKDELLKKFADFDSLKEKAEKYEEVNGQLGGLKLEVAFNSVKPSFPDSVNKYEASAKWDEFKKEVLSLYNIELVDGEPMAISKDNQYSKTKLSELLKKNESISSLIVGRQQKGTGGKELKDISIDGVPFKLTDKATTAEISKEIKEYLTGKGISIADTKYSDKFQEIFDKIKKQKTAE